MAHNIVYFSFICICLFPAASAQLKPGNDSPPCADVAYSGPFDYAKLCPGGRVLEIECQIADGSRAKFKLGEAGLSHCRVDDMFLYSCVSSGICPPSYTGAQPIRIPGGSFYTVASSSSWPPAYTRASSSLWPPAYTDETPTIPGAPFYTAQTPTVFPPGYTGPTETQYSPFLGLIYSACMLLLPGSYTTCLRGVMCIPYP